MKADQGPRTQQLAGIVMAAVFWDACEEVIAETIAYFEVIDKFDRKISAELLSQYVILFLVLVVTRRYLFKLK